MATMLSILLIKVEFRACARVESHVGFSYMKTIRGVEFRACARVERSTDQVNRVFQRG